METAGRARALKVGNEWASVTEHRGPWINTVSGNRFYLLDPQPEDVFISDIAYSLSNLNRFTGHLEPPFSVAEHSMLVSRLVPRKHALLGLLHDAGETYTGDITRPLKEILNQETGGKYKILELGIDLAISQKFGLPWPWPHDVLKKADNLALATEIRDRMNTSNNAYNPREAAWMSPAEPLADVSLKNYRQPVDVELAFMLRFEELTRKWRRPA